MKNLIVFISVFLLGFVGVVESKSFIVSKPYMTDVDTIAHEKNKAKLLKIIVNLDEYKKCHKTSYSCRSMVERDYLKNNLTHFERGSLEYVQKKYFYLNKYKKKSRKLKRLLTNLLNLSKKTRQLGPLDEKKVGELTRNEVSSEICLIESYIGSFVSKSYCNESSL